MNQTFFVDFLINRDFPYSRAANQLSFGEDGFGIPAMPRFENRDSTKIRRETSLLVVADGL